MPRCSKPKVKMANKSTVKMVRKTPKPVDEVDLIVLAKLVDRLFDQIAELKATNKEHEKKINEIVTLLQTMNNSAQDDWEIPEGEESPEKDDLDQIVGNVE